MNLVPDLHYCHYWPQHHNHAEGNVLWLLAYSHHCGRNLLYSKIPRELLSFVRENCEFADDYEAGSTEMFNAYKGYCEECGLKPYSQRMFVQQLTASLPNVKRGVDALGKRRILSGIRLCEMLG